MEGNIGALHRSWRYPPQKIQWTSCLVIGSRCPSASKRLLTDLMEDVKKGKITFSRLMEFIREQTHRLVIDVLLGDFGLNEEDLLITFSGGRGYHVHVRTPAVLTLPSGA